MRFLGLFFAIFILGGTWVFGKAINVEIKKPFQGQFIPTEVFEDERNTGRLETIICPQGQFLTPSRVCLKPEDFMQKKTIKPKNVATMAPNNEKGRKWDRIANKCEEASTVAPKVKVCERGEAYSVNEGKCVRRPFMQTIG